MKLKCSGCQKLLETSNFSIKSGSKRGYHYKCKKCHNDYVRNKWYPKNSEKQKESSRLWKENNKTKCLAKKYNCSEELIQSLLYVGSCQICGSCEDLNIDHCHNTNIVRGILCGRCNKGIGLMLDNIDILKKAIDYLS